MSPEQNKYKIATWILGVVVVVLLGMLWMKDSETVSDEITNASESLTECRVSIAAWTTAHPPGVIRTDEDRAELDVILESCADSLE